MTFLFAFLDHQFGEGERNTCLIYYPMPRIHHQPIIIDEVSVTMGTKGHRGPAVSQGGFLEKPCLETFFEEVWKGKTMGDMEPSCITFPLRMRFPWEQMWEPLCLANGGSTELT